MSTISNVASEQAAQQTSATNGTEGSGGTSSVIDDEMEYVTLLWSEAGDDVNGSMTFQDAVNILAENWDEWSQSDSHGTYMSRSDLEAIAYSTGGEYTEAEKEAARLIVETDLFSALDSEDFTESEDGLIRSSGIAAVQSAIAIELSEMTVQEAVQYAFTGYEDWAGASTGHANDDGDPAVLSALDIQAVANDDGTNFNSYEIYAATVLLQSDDPSLRELFINEDGDEGIYFATKDELSNWLNVNGVSGASGAEQADTTETVSTASSLEDYVYNNFAELSGGDGEISRPDIAAAIQNVESGSSEANMLWELLDRFDEYIKADGDAEGDITFEDAEAMKNASDGVSVDPLAAASKVLSLIDTIDTDNDGKISGSELTVAYDNARDQGDTLLANQILQVATMFGTIAGLDGDDDTISNEDLNFYITSGGSATDGSGSDASLNTEESAAAQYLNENFDQIAGGDDYASYGDVLVAQQALDESSDEYAHLEYVLTNYTDFINADGDVTDGGISQSDVNIILGVEDASEGAFTASEVANFLMTSSDIDVDDDGISLSELQTAYSARAGSDDPAVQREAEMIMYATENFDDFIALDDDPENTTRISNEDLEAAIEGALDSQASDESNVAESAAAQYLNENFDQIAGGDDYASYGDVLVAQQALDESSDEYAHLEYVLTNYTDFINADGDVTDGGISQSDVNIILGVEDASEGAFTASEVANFLMTSSDIDVDDDGISLSELQTAYSARAGSDDPAVQREAEMIMYATENFDDFIALDDDPENTTRISNEDLEAAIEGALDSQASDESNVAESAAAQYLNENFDQIAGGDDYASYGDVLVAQQALDESSDEYAHLEYVLTNYTDFINADGDVTDGGISQSDVNIILGVEDASEGAFTASEIANFLMTSSDIDVDDDGISKEELLAAYSARAGSDDPAVRREAEMIMDAYGMFDEFVKLDDDPENTDRISTADLQAAIGGELDAEASNESEGEFTPGDVADFLTNSSDINVDGNGFSLAELLNAYTARLEDGSPEARAEAAMLMFAIENFKDFTDLEGGSDSSEITSEDLAAAAGGALDHLPTDQTQKISAALYINENFDTLSGGDDFVSTSDLAAAQAEFEPGSEEYELLQFAIENIEFFISSDTVLDAGGISKNDLEIILGAGSGDDGMAFEAADYVLSNLNAVDPDGDGITLDDLEAHHGTLVSSGSDSASLMTYMLENIERYASMVTSDGYDTTTITVNDLQAVVANGGLSTADDMTLADAVNVVKADFEAFDSDNDGEITGEELTAVVDNSNNSVFVKAAEVLIEGFTSVSADNSIITQQDLEQYTDDSGTTGGAFGDHSIGKQIEILNDFFNDFLDFDISGGDEIVTRGELQDIAADEMNSLSDIASYILSVPGLLEALGGSDGVDLTELDSFLMTGGVSDAQVLQALDRDFTTYAELNSEGEYVITVAKLTEIMDNMDGEYTDEQVAVATSLLAYAHHAQPTGLWQRLASGDGTISQAELDSILESDSIMTDQDAVAIMHANIDDWDATGDQLVGVEELRAVAQSTAADGDYTQEEIDAAAYLLSRPELLDVLDSRGGERGNDGWITANDITSMMPYFELDAASAAEALSQYHGDWADDNSEVGRDKLLEISANVNGEYTFAEQKTAQFLLLTPGMFETVSRGDDSISASDVVDYKENVPTEVSSAATVALANFDTWNQGGDDVLTTLELLDVANSDSYSAEERQAASILYEAFGDISGGDNGISRAELSTMSATSGGAFTYETQASHLAYLEANYSDFTNENGEVTEESLNLILTAPDGEDATGMMKAVANTLLNTPSLFAEVSLGDGGISAADIAEFNGYGGLTVAQAVQILEANFHSIADYENGDAVVTQSTLANIISEPEKYSDSVVAAAMKISGDPSGLFGAIDGGDDQITLTDIKAYAQDNEIITYGDVLNALATDYDSFNVDGEAYLSMNDFSLIEANAEGLYSDEQVAIARYILTNPSVFDELDAPQVSRSRDLDGLIGSQSVEFLLQYENLNEYSAARGLLHFHDLWKDENGLVTADKLQEISQNVDGTYTELEVNIANFILGTDMMTRMDKSGDSDGVTRDEADDFIRSRTIDGLNYLDQHWERLSMGGTEMSVDLIEEIAANANGEWTDADVEMAENLLENRSFLDRLAEFTEDGEGVFLQSDVVAMLINRDAYMSETEAVEVFVRDFNQLSDNVGTGDDLMSLNRLEEIAASNPSDSEYTWEQIKAARVILSNPDLVERLDGADGHSGPDDKFKHRELATVERNMHFAVLEASWDNLADDEGQLTYDRLLEIALNEDGTFSREEVEAAEYLIEHDELWGQLAGDDNAVSWQDLADHLAENQREEHVREFD